MILVDIYAPVVDQTYDFLLDENADLSSVMLEVIEMISKKTGSDRLSDSEDFILYNADKENPISPASTLYESGVRDGDRLILV